MAKGYSKRFKKGSMEIIDPKTKKKKTVIVPYEEKVLSQKILQNTNPIVSRTEEDEIDLDKTHEKYDILNPTWNVLYDCFVGGGNIHNAGDNVYLIKKENEPQKKYDQRKRGAIYYNKPAQIITTFQSHIWRKEPERILPSQLEIYKDNVDRLGRSANKFFSFITKMAQIFGIYYVLVEYPLNPFIKNANDSKEIQDELRRISEADEKLLNLRPYFCPIDPRNILDWGWRELEDGSSSLNYIVIKEKKMLFNVPFLKTKSQIQYRIIWPNKQEIYTYIDLPGNKKEIIKVGERMISIGKIPLVPFYSEEMEYGVGKSAIFDIVDLALEYYNKHSDRQHAETMSAFPFLFLKGFSTEDDLIISEEMAIRNESEHADAKYLEITGNSIEALRESEKMILNEIFDLALKQIRPSGNARQTAEAKRLDRLDSLSDIQTRAIGFSNSEQMCWEYAAMWEKLDYRKNEDIKINYNLDFDMYELESDLIRALLDLRISKDLSRETLWEILQNGEILPRNFSKEMEKEKISEEEIGEISLISESKNFNKSEKE